MNIQASKRLNKGATLVEFTIVSTFFFILIFSIIEFGRLLFTWHVLNETTRRTARLATVCQITSYEQQQTITSAIINGVPLPNFTSTNIRLHYLDNLGNIITGDLTDTTLSSQIKYVQASINSYQIALIIPLATFDITFTAPEFKTILPRESLGVTRTGFTDC
ncbi:TadZ/CpaE protein [Photobacterium lutimaris]|uniref:TadZ/CpaE protein n=2 Tax=Photobacterium lutimaris TaxID=388278 RepID=A0A2T3J5B8_9GAMM|nr:TadZ/CpaE protein [Photobacterium lutimaris]